MTVPTAHTEAGSLELGATFAGYRISVPVGVDSGTGIVYAATALAPEQLPESPPWLPLALKVFSSPTASEPSLMRGFVETARLQSTIHHPNVVSIYEVGTSPSPFLSMTLVRGLTLAELIASARLDDTAALEVARCVTAALEAGREQGLIHRNLRPGSVLLPAGEARRAMLGDFGAGRPPDVEADVASNVRALGAILFECLTCQSPTQTSCCLREFRPDLPPALEGVLSAALDEDPDRRQESPAELLDAVEHVFPHRRRGRQPRPVERRTREVEAPAADTQALPAGDEQTDGGADGRGRDGRSREGRFRRARGGGQRLREQPRRGQQAAAAPAAAQVGREVAEREGLREAPGTEDRDGQVREAPATEEREERARESRPREEREREQRWPLPGSVLGLGLPLAALLALGLIAAAVFGAIVAPGGSEGSAPKEVRTEGLSLRYPPDWTRATRAPQVPGLNLRNPVAVIPPGTDGDNSALVAGTLPREGQPGGLPKSLSRRLQSQSREAVELGSVQAYRYAGLRPADFDRQATLYLVPTDAEAVVVGCVAPVSTSGFMEDCERIASTLRLSGARPVSLAPSPTYARGLRNVVSRLSADRRGARRQLRGARTRRGQVAAAARLSRSYRKAQREAARLTPPPAARELENRIERSLAAAARGYGRIAAAARSARGGEAWRAGRREAIAGERALQDDLKGLRALGYGTQP